MRSGLAYAGGYGVGVAWSIRSAYFASIAVRISTGESPCC